jgi:hypothetical protein
VTWGISGPFLHIKWGTKPPTPNPSCVGHIPLEEFCPPKNDPRSCLGSSEIKKEFSTEVPFNFVIVPSTEKFLKRLWDTFDECINLSRILDSVWEASRNLTKIALLPLSCTILLV